MKMKPPWPSPGPWPGQGVTFDEPPREGKVNLLAARDGLLVVDEAPPGEPSTWSPG